MYSTKAVYEVNKGLVLYMQDKQSQLYRLAYEGSWESFGSSSLTGGCFLLELFAFIEREKGKCGYRNRDLHYCNT